ANVNARDIDHESTPAQYLVRDHQDIVRFLISKGSDTDILMAAAIGDLALATRLLDQDPEPVRTTVSDQWFPKLNPRAGGSIYIWTLGQKKSAHAIAREFGRDDVFKLLMDRSPDTLKLSTACEIGKESLVRELIAAQPHLARALSPGEQTRIVDA